jgi:acetyl-CoA acetyltransferase
MTSEARGAVAVVGVGHTDYASDWRRAREASGTGASFHDGYGYGARALAVALRDAGLAKEDIDGLAVGAPLTSERMGEVLGLDVAWSTSGDVAHAIQEAISAITVGYASCIALVFGTSQKTSGYKYGGPSGVGTARHLAYTFFEPWGLTSQGALYALLTRRYMELFGLTDRAVGAVVVGQRAFAGMNDFAVMNHPLSIDDYLASPFVVEPLRRLDYTIVNDGGVALIVTAHDRATALVGRRAVGIDAFASYDLNSGGTSLEPRLLDFYHSGHQAVAERLYHASGYGPQDIDVVGVYDSFSCHVPVALAGFGFCRDEDVNEFLLSGATAPGGRVPVNTAGGHLSESYLQGWNHQIELVRQLRGEAGPRQVDGARRGLYVSDVAGRVRGITLSNEGTAL